MSNYYLREQGLGHMIALKTAAIESAKNKRATTIGLGIYTLIANI